MTYVEIKEDSLFSHRQIIFHKFAKISGNINKLSIKLIFKYLYFDNHLLLI